MRRILKTTIRELYDPVPDYLNVVDFETVEVIEMEPSRRTFRWNLGSRDDPDIQTASWPLPYMQFGFFLGLTSVFCSSRPREKLENLRLTPFPNQYEDGLVCQDDAETIEEAISVFFGSVFERPCSWRGPVDFAGRHPELREAVKTASFNSTFSDAWEELSVDDMLEFDWLRMPIARIASNWQCCIPRLIGQDDNPWGAGTIYPFLVRATMTRKSRE